MFEILAPERGNCFRGTGFRISLEYFDGYSTLHGCSLCGQAGDTRLFQQHPIWSMKSGYLRWLLKVGRASARLDHSINIFPQCCPGCGEVNKICDEIRRHDRRQIGLIPQHNPWQRSMLADVAGIRIVHHPDVQPALELVVCVDRPGLLQQFEALLGDLEAFNG